MQHRERISQNSPVLFCQYNFVKALNISKAQPSMWFWFHHFTPTLSLGFFLSLCLWPSQNLAIIAEISLHNFPWKFENFHRKSRNSLNICLYEDLLTNLWEKVVSIIDLLPNSILHALESVEFPYYGRQRLLFFLASTCKSTYFLYNLVFVYWGSISAKKYESFMFV